MSETYDNFEVRRVLMEITPNLAEQMEDNGFECDPRILIAVQTMCFSAIAHLDRTVVGKREAQEMEETFKAFSLIPEDSNE